MKSIKDIHKLVERKGGAGAFNRGYGNALEDVLGLIDEFDFISVFRGIHPEGANYWKNLEISQANVKEELKARITG